MLCRLRAVPAFVVGTTYRKRLHGSIRSSWVVSASSKKQINLDKKYQPELSASEKKGLRTKSQQLAKELVTVQLGAKGLTLPFYTGLFAALQSNQMVKVRMGCTREEKRDLAGEICDVLDCVCVHSIGTTVVLYRSKGLPKPVRLQDMETDVRDDDEEDDVATSTEAAAPGGPVAPPPPPEFTVL